MPAERALDEVEDSARVATGEEDREPSADDGEEDADVEEEEDEVVGDGEQPLDQWQPPLEPLGIGVGKVEVDGLLFVRRGVFVVHQRHVDADPVAEA